MPVYKVKNDSNLSAMYNLLHKPIKIFLVLLFPFALTAQKQDTALQTATRENCIHYAIQQNPNLKNSRITEQIVETIIKSKLADWYPQIGMTYNFQHNFELPSSFANGQAITTGVDNTS